ncbi:asparaginase [Streptomyces sp. AJS327]|uniref:asparaginase n=1 Tax=Streptomyces sp. AJS327 TaxID=2545265 RepID=UPI0015DFF729|nr:asparaginase [Streptomyces sp. AJS327]MBA0053825.1 asparaginase [Streptomyces sp. AJS327]
MPTPVSSDPAVSALHPSPHPVLAEVVRSGFVEGLHRGSLVALAADGGVEWSLGEVAVPVFPRSTNKPAQAAGVLRAGLDLAGERLALAAASHSGERVHLDLVHTLLSEYGLTPDDLRCPPALPLDPEESARYLAAGHSPARTVMDCSGKHAAMLGACRVSGWPLESYLEPDHPLQRLIRTTVENAAGEPVAHTGVDGCGAPLLALSLTGIARMFRTVALAAPETPEGRVARAMREHPLYVAGRRRHDTWLMRALPGALAKVGAEAVQGFALPDGRALALKLDDGAGRALGPVLARALALLGVEDPVLERVAEAPVRGADGVVGAVRAAF